MSGIPKDILAKKRATWADMQDDKSTACPTTLAALTEVESTLASEVASTGGCSTRSPKDILAKKRVAWAYMYHGVSTDLPIHAAGILARG